MMLMPGFSSTRVPVQVRLLLAIAITLVLAPLLLPDVRAAIAGQPSEALVTSIVSEMLIGATIGVMAQLFFLALETLATAATMAIGFGPIPGTAIEGLQPQPTLVSFITMSAVVLLFLTGQEWEVLRALSASYVAFPVTEFFSAQFSLARLTTSAAESFLLSLRITSPFIIYAVVVNFSVGLVNKLTPQIPIYFISLPFIFLGGLLLLYFVAPEMLHLFIDGFASWLARV